MIIQSDYALPAPGVLLRDVRLETSGDRIASVTAGGRKNDPPADYDFGAAVITPGLVNAHAHLELEFCSGAVPFDGSFVNWLQTIRDLKRARGGISTTYPRRSMDDLLAVGCTTVIDHHTCDLEWPAIEEHGLRHVPIREVFGFNNHTPDSDTLRRICRRSVAAHAPYTASLELARTCHGIARELGQPVSTHLSEFTGEINFIRDGEDAEISRLLKLAQADESGFKGHGRTPVRLYAEAGLLSSMYAVHVNYLQDDDLELLAAYKPTVVFCPRSHVFFGHSRHPLPELLAAGVPVALGTDSLASNDRLSPLHEAALVREKYPEVAAADVFAAITSRGLAPLGWDLLLGELEQGRIADLAVFPLVASPAVDFGAVFDAVISAGRAALTVVGGEVRQENTRHEAARR